MATSSKPKPESKTHFNRFQLILEPELSNRIREVLPADQLGNLLHSLQSHCQNFLAQLHTTYPLEQIGFGAIKSDLANTFTRFLGAKLEELESEDQYSQRESDGIAALIYRIGDDLVIHLTSSADGLLTIAIGTIPTVVTAAITKDVYRLYHLDTIHKIEPLM